MAAIHVGILRTDDPPLWPDVTPVEHTTQPWHIAVIEGGMESGRPSIMLRLEMAVGIVVSETSLAMWIAATCAMRGAFPEAFADSPLAARDEG